MFLVTETERAAIRAAWAEGGEEAATAELRRHFPGIADNATARLAARAIASWGSLAAEAPAPVKALRPKRPARSKRDGPPL